MYNAQNGELIQYYASFPRPCMGSVFNVVQDDHAVRQETLMHLQ